jgi:transposase
VRAFEFFGGTTVMLVPDNLKRGGEQSWGFLSWQIIDKKTGAANEMWSGNRLTDHIYEAEDSAYMVEI